MTTKHTPGPLLHKNGEIYSEATGHTIACITSYGTNEDGELFAVAHKLLEICQRIKQQIHVGNVVLETSKDVHDLCRAIAKAEGR